MNSADNVQKIISMFIFSLRLEGRELNYVTFQAITGKNQMSQLHGLIPSSPVNTILVMVAVV